MIPPAASAISRWSAISPYSLLQTEFIATLRARWSSVLVLVPIGIRFERTLLRHPDVARLRVAELGEHCAELFQLQPRHFLVEVLRQQVHADRVPARALLRFRPELDLREGLVGERRAHHVGGGPGRAAGV